MFPDRLNALLDERNVNAAKLSKEAEITERLIGYWRKGEKQPTMDNLIKLADYFNVSIDYLVGRSNDPMMK